MILKIKKNILLEMEQKFPENLAFLPAEHRWSNDKELDSKYLNEDEVKYLLEIYVRDENKEHIEDRRIATSLRAVLKLLNNKDQKLTSLKAMAEALTMYLMPLKNHWVFVQDRVANVALPYLVTEIRWHDSNRDNPQYVSLKGIAIRRGKHDSFGKSIYREDLTDNGLSAGALLESLGIMPESDELMADYEENLAKYNTLRDTGLQIVGTGKVLIQEERWHKSVVSLDQGGIPAKLVVDDQVDFGTNSNITSNSMWSSKVAEDGDTDKVYRLPVHTFVRAFSLKQHSFMEINTANVEKYIYEEGLDDKLVLSPDKRELIDMLVSSGGDDSRDIVQGKSGGVIIITSGPPGTGKTLSSEVYSEKVKRPLYVVQCSQLGTDADELEKKLNEVLERASRWQAVLLIDEADVYIHERGNDIQQNAIVGVFLRVLEYYSGVLFMTTNRETVTDDAIMSRAIAHVRYSLPNEEEAMSLWKILSAQYGVSLSDETCKALTEKFVGISGRSIKQLLRLGKALANNRGVELTVGLVEEVSKFQNIEKSESNPSTLTLRGGRKFPVG